MSTTTTMVCPGSGTCARGGCATSCAVFDEIRAEDARDRQQRARREHLPAIARAAPGFDAEAFGAGVAELVGQEIDAQFEKIRKAAEDHRVEMTEFVHREITAALTPEYLALVVRQEVTRAVALIPPALPGEQGEPGLPGRDGEHGRDGFEIDDVDVALSGERTIVFTVRSGNREVSRSVKLPVPVYRGVHRSGAPYEKGDMVTHGGSMWVSMRDTANNPGDTSDAWRLATKRGADGRSAPSL